MDNWERAKMEPKMKQLDKNRSQKKIVRAVNKINILIIIIIVMHLYIYFTLGDSSCRDLGYFSV